MKTQIGDLVTADLHEGTLTIEVGEEIVAQAGKYAVVPIDEYKKLVSDDNTEQKALHIDSVMPRRLTAENGAKALLCGEFNETIVCHDEDGEPYEVKMPVEWTTIKEIYAKIVDYYGA